MLNDILTGKASIEPPPPDPYREPAVPDVTKRCEVCRNAFTAKATSTQTRCPDCFVADLHVNSTESRQAYAQAVASLERSRRGAQFWGWILAVVLAGGAYFVRYQMREQAREDARAMRPSYGYESGYSNDPLSSELSGIADKMCRCVERKSPDCARDAQSAYALWLRTLRDSRVEDSARDAIASASNRYLRCLDEYQQQQ